MLDRKNWPFQNDDLNHPPYAISSGTVSTAREITCAEKQEMIRRSYAGATVAPTAAVTPDTIKLLPIGTKVYVGNDIPATITAIVVRMLGTQYEVSWWDGCTRRSDWFTTDQITSKDPIGHWNLIKSE